MRAKRYGLALALGVLTLLAGCASTPTRVETVEVQVPVRVACTVAEPEEPTWAVPLLMPGSPVYKQMRALLADRTLAGAYSAELLAALRACKS